MNFHLNFEEKPPKKFELEWYLLPRDKIYWFEIGRFSN